MAKIDEIEKMLKAVLGSLTGFRQEFLGFKNQVFQKFDDIDKRFDEMDKKFNRKIDTLDEKLTKRIDAIGKQLAYLEDDAPTRDEFENHEQRISKLEQKPAAL